MNHDHDQAPEPEKRRMSYRIPAQNQTPDDHEFYRAMISAVFGEKVNGETPGYDLPDWLEFTSASGTVTITTRFFPTERGIGFIIGGTPFTLTLLPASKAKASEKQALLDMHDLLSKRNAQDGIEYPHAEFAFAEAQTKRLNIEGALKRAQKELEWRRREERAEIGELIGRFTIAELADKAGIEPNTMTEHANTLRKSDAIKTPPRQKLTKKEAIRLLRHVQTVGHEGARKIKKPAPRLAE